MGGRHNIQSVRGTLNGNRHRRFASMVCSSDNNNVINGGLSGCAHLAVLPLPLLLLLFMTHTGLQHATLRLLRWPLPRCHAPCNATVATSCLRAVCRHLLCYWLPHAWPRLRHTTVRVCCHIRGVADFCRYSPAFLVILYRLPRAATRTAPLFSTAPLPP